MPLLLTKFHMYLEITILQDLYMRIQWKINKKAHSDKV